jgi:2-polyprenyl-6-methoxyphenol hydroxylase-like FAD-dependent oxidoreductase
MMMLADTVALCGRMLLLVFGVNSSELRTHECLREERGGTGLGVDRGLITETTGVDARVDGLTHALPVVDEGYRETSTWLAIYRWLRAVADATNGLNVHESARVDVISSDDRVAHLSGPQVNTSAAVIIGADGYRSVVRRAISPTQPYAPYGGFLLWRALVEESWLPKQLQARTSLGGGRLPHPEAARLVVYRVPGPNGETSRGQRSIIATVGRSGGTAGQAGIRALQLYDEARLAPNRRRVHESLAETRDLLRSTANR